MKKLIFINDSPLDHFILNRILSKYQLEYEVICTASGAEVISLLEKNKKDIGKLPDVILVDLYMPNFDGWDFLDMMEHLYPHLAKPLRIYLLSSSINPRDIEQAKEYSCERSFIFKPITREVLEKCIDEESSAA
ncbi:MAG TPA: response regulator [Mucilaginibacter sp.]|jgi:CheY-like chemotaxis protein|nr:response regulator [Mucilaginibacter sp.]